MFDPEFFPTPSNIARKMWEPLRNCAHVLEPSAGKGDLIDWIVKDFEYGHSKQPRCDAIEKNTELQFILKGKGYNVIHDDFMTFIPSRKYGGIIMNPPFSKGAEHLLYAWNLLSGGTIVCLLNAETVKNKCSQTRILLGSIIEDHGEVEFLGTCFDNAQRKTNVEVCMVTLTKEDNNDEFGFFAEFASDRDLESFDMESCSATDLAHSDTVGTMAELYKDALAAHKDFLKAKNKVLFYTKHLSSRISQEELLDNYAGDSRQYNSFVDKLNEACWDSIFEKTDIHRFITSGVRKEFDAFRDGNKIIDFTEHNILALLRTLGMSAGTIMEKALVAVFDNLTRYDKKNRVHVEGWKTNDFYRVNRKVIIPNITGPDYNGGPSFLFWSRQETLTDIDRVMCSLEGKDFGNIITIVDALKTSFSESWGEVAQSEFFEIKYYKKGTVHLIFKSEDLWARFNKSAAKGKNWLPGER